MNKVNREFLRYVLPSVLSFALSGVYTIVDGYFIGNRLGDIGIAAVTLGYPVTAFVQALGTGIGLAGGIRYTIHKARGEMNASERCLGGSVLLMLLGSGAVMSLVLLLLYPLLELLGARGTILEPTAEYVRYIILGTAFQVLGTGLVPFIRNMRGAGFAMAAMLCGFGTNIVLDWLFVWRLPYGMMGAALATVLGQALTALMAVVWLIKKRAPFKIPQLRTLPRFFGEIAQVAAAPFGLVLCPNITLLFMNRFILEYGDEQALAVYGVIGYVVFIVILLLQGVNDGSQPLISRFYGEGDEKSMLYTRKLSYLTGFFVAALSIVIVLLGLEGIGPLFGASARSGEDVARILPWFMAAMPFEAYVRTGSSYLYATEKSGLSYLLVYAEPVLILFFLWILAHFMGLAGVWLANPTARFSAAVIAWAVKFIDDRRSLGLCRA